MSPLAAAFGFSPWRWGYQPAPIIRLTRCVGVSLTRGFACAHGCDVAAWLRKRSIALGRAQRLIHLSRRAGKRSVPATALNHGSGGHGAAHLCAPYVSLSTPVVPAVTAMDAYRCDVRIAHRNTLGQHIPL